jgi:hypothetical protein
MPSTAVCFIGALLLGAQVEGTKEVRTELLLIEPILYPGTKGLSFQTRRTRIHVNGCKLVLRDDKLYDLEACQPQEPNDGNLQGKQLDLSNQKIRIVKEGAFKMLTGLEKLRLESNRIPGFDQGTFEGLGKLKHLYLYNNDMQDDHLHQHRLPLEVFEGIDRGCYIAFEFDPKHNHPEWVRHYLPFTLSSTVLMASFVCANRKHWIRSHTHALTTSTRYQRLVVQGERTNTSCESCPTHPLLRPAFAPQHTRPLRSSF